MPLIPNLLGQRIPHGRTRQMVVDFDAALASALPDGLTLDGTPTPTLTFDNIDSVAGRGTAKVTSIAGAGNTAGLLGPAIVDPSRIAAIFWWFEGLEFDSASSGLFDIRFGLDGAGAGGYFNQANSTAADYAGRYTTVRVVGAGGAVAPTPSTARYVMRDTHRKNMCMGLFPRWKAMVLQAEPGDLASNVYVVDNATAMVTNQPITPRLTITNTNTAAHHFQFTACRLMIESY